ncbi:MAG: hypothetical protein AB7S26_27820 [Sandaracinaceae bacterium]
MTGRATACGEAVFAIVAIAAGCLVIGSSLALAQSDDATVARARARFDEGTVHYREGRYLDAAIAYEDAYELSPRPLILRNVATAFERALELGQAADAYERYLTEAGHPDDEAEIRERIARLRELDRASRGGPAADPIPPPPTPAEAAVWAAPVAAPVPPVRVDPIPPISPAVAPQDPVVSVDAGRGPSAWGVTGAVTGSLSVIALAIAIGYGVAALDHASEVRMSCPSGDVCERALDALDVQRARDAAFTSSGFGYVSLGLGAFAVLATVLAILEESGSERERAFTLTPNGVAMAFP